MTELYLILFFFISILLMFIGWKLRRLYKKIVFFFLKRKGKLSEIKAKALLIKYNYRIVKEQFYQFNYLYENNKKKEFTTRPDFLVEKDGIFYVAEVKSGLSCSLENIYTRRQLLEYSYYSKNKTVILVDTQNSILKKVSFEISN